MIVAAAPESGRQRHAEERSKRVSDLREALIDNLLALHQLHVRVLFFGPNTIRFWESVEMEEADALVGVATVVTTLAAASVHDEEAAEAPLLPSGAKRSDRLVDDKREEVRIKGLGPKERVAEASANALKQARLWLRDAARDHPQLHRWLWRIPVGLLGVNLYYLDTASDLVLMQNLYVTGNPVWATETACFVFLQFLAIQSNWVIRIIQIFILLYYFIFRKWD